MNIDDIEEDGPRASFADVPEFSVPSPAKGEPRMGWRMNQGAILYHANGSVRAFSGEVVPADDPCVLAHPDIGREATRVEMD